MNMAAPNVPPRRVSMSYLLGFSNIPFKEPKPPRAPHGPRPGSFGDLVSTPGGVVEWAASDGRKGKLTGPGKTRAYGEVMHTAPVEKGGQATTGRPTENSEAGKAGNGDGGEEDNPHGFTPDEDNKMIQWKTANPSGQWKIFADEIGKQPSQCKERWRQIQPKDNDQNPGAQQGRKGGCGPQNQQQPQEKKLTKKEKKALKQGSGGGQNENQGQDSRGGAGVSGNSTAGNGGNDNSWEGGGFPFDIGAASVTGASDKHDQNNDPLAAWGAPNNSGNAGDSSGWQDPLGPGGWGDHSGGGGGNDATWGNNNGAGSTKGGGKKKDKKDGGSWNPTNNDLGNNAGWGDDPFHTGDGSNKDGGGTNRGAAASNKNSTKQAGGSILCRGAASNKSGGSIRSAGGAGDWVVDGANDQGWGGAEQKSASNAGGYNNDDSGAQTGHGGIETNVEPWNANTGDSNSPANNNCGNAAPWTKTAPPAPVPPEVFEKKITGGVEGQERERGERKKRR
ncbi:hypothetical protein DE146DRAFT_106446 [Phaeosphaeria sp. MPI-PUGE-AT-0046c]|nr:hypothetical protein DE146DRAFT_106446 [Phaeosphaeria sp. MPI-PUGE-AT-0046c]